MAGAPDDYLDPARRPPSVPEGGADALVGMCDPPINRGQAEFAAFTMYNGGVFVTGQVAEWLDARQPSWCADSDPQVRRQWATRWAMDLFLPSFPGGGRLVTTKTITGVLERSFAHFAYTGAYRVLGIRESRYRRTPNAGVVLQRLLLFDYVCSHLDPAVTWYGSSAQKEHLFTSLGLPRTVFPFTDFRSKTTGAQTRRYFADHMPIGFSEWRVIFPIAFGDDYSLDSSITRLEKYLPLWTALRALGVAVEVAVVLQRVDAGEWQQRLSRYSRPQDRDDRLRTVTSVERYLIRRLQALRGPGLAATYGGAAGVRRRLSELDEALRVPVSLGGALSLDIWYADRLSTGPWAVPLARAARVV